MATGTRSFPHSLTRCSVVTLAHPDSSGRDLLTDNELRQAYDVGVSTLYAVYDERLATVVRLPYHVWGKCAGAEDDLGTATWLTVGLAYPCTCNLELWKSAYCPQQEPPLSSDLYILPPQPDPDNIPRFGDDLLPWSTVEFEELDLDPSLDGLEDFEIGWHDTTSWERTKGKGKARSIVRRDSEMPMVTGKRSSFPSPLVVDTLAVVKPLVENTTNITQAPTGTHAPVVSVSETTAQVSLPAVTRTRLDILSSPVVPFTPPPLISHPLRIAIPPTPTPLTPALSVKDLAKESLRRKSWWRTEIERDGQYGQVWTILPRHTYPVLPTSLTQSRLSSRSVRSDNFRPFRNLDSLTHPLHPDISYYGAHARARVYWIIPVNGPVIIPTLSDPVDNLDAKPWPSRAILNETDYLLNAAKEEPRPAVVRWTPTLLRAFVRERFEPIWRDPTRPYSALHLSVSGPKPDPFLGLPPPRPLTKHQHVPIRPERVSPGQADPSLTPADEKADTAESIPPVRPECGDHLRIYCDASRAMSFRTWLHWCELGVPSQNDKHDAHTGEEVVAAPMSRSGTEFEFEPVPTPTRTPTSIRPFERARLTLVGPRGEVLMIA